MKIRSLFLCANVFAMILAGCGEQTAPPPPPPSLTCGSSSVTDNLLSAYAKKLLDEGAKGFADVDINKALSISAVVAKEKNQSTGQLKCQAKVSINYPDDLAEKIGDAFSEELKRNNLRDRLEERLGIVDGSGVYNQLNAMVSDGPFGFVPDILTADKSKNYKEVILKNTKYLFGEQLAVPVFYEFSPQKDAEGNSDDKFKWYVLRREPLDANVVILSLQGLL